MFCCGGRSKGPEKCGVGLLFEELEEGGLVVAEILLGGPAWQTGKIAAGDILYEVEGVGVYRSDAREVRDLVLGNEGTWVWLGFKRGERYQNDSVFRVQLPRMAGVPGVGHLYMRVQAD
mmetsp:Transcript_38179/g.93822  ORF Transcript_38179/g.93822 Transcript_38179/m.93822 type:complete len:119 (+) Transcript_38179:235-591(+)